MAGAGAEVEHVTGEKEAGVGGRFLQERKRPRVSWYSGRGLDGREHSGRRWQVAAGQGWWGQVTAREGSEFSGTGCSNSRLFQGTLGGRQVLVGKEGRPRWEGVEWQSELL